MTETTDMQGCASPDASDRPVACGATHHFAQLFYFKQIEQATGKKSVMARVALNAAGFRDEYPVVLSELMYGIGWSDHQATLSFLTFAMGIRIEWDSIQLDHLRQWATTTSAGFS